jgi:hypothetical protein
VPVLPLPAVAFKMARASLNDLREQEKHLQKEKKSQEETLADCRHPNAGNGSC